MQVPGREQFYMYVVCVYIMCKFHRLTVLIVDCLKPKTKTSTLFLLRHHLLFLFLFVIAPRIPGLSNNVLKQPLHQYNVVPHQHGHQSHVPKHLIRFRRGNAAQKPQLPRPIEKATRAINDQRQRGQHHGHHWAGVDKA